MCFIFVGEAVDGVCRALDLRRQLLRRCILVRTRNGHIVDQILVAEAIHPAVLPGLLCALVILTRRRTCIRVRFNPICRVRAAPVPALGEFLCTCQFIVRLHPLIVPLKVVDAGAHQAVHLAKEQHGHIIGGALRILRIVRRRDSDRLILDLHVIPDRILIGEGIADARIVVTGHGHEDLPRDQRQDRLECPAQIRGADIVELFVVGDIVQHVLIGDGHFVFAKLNRCTSLLTDIAVRLHAPDRLDRNSDGTWIRCHGLRVFAVLPLCP